VLYAGNKEAQHSYIERQQEKGYEVLLLTLQLSSLDSKIEGDNKDITLYVDSDHIDNLIKKRKLLFLNLKKKPIKKTVLEAIVPNKTTKFN
jgi:molecular chaperone HtpG